MFSDNRLRSIPDSEQQSTLCVEYWTSKILIELSGYKSLELDDVQEMVNIRVVKAWQQEIENDFTNLKEKKKATLNYLTMQATVFFVDTNL